MSVELPTEQHLEILSLKGGCTGSSESTLVKMPQCWKSHVMAQFIIITPLHVPKVNKIYVTLQLSWFRFVILIRFQQKWDNHLTGARMGIVIAFSDNSH